MEVMDNSIDEALAELDGEQLAQLDLTRYESLCEALTTLTAEQAGEHTHYLCGSDTCTGLGGARRVKRSHSRNGPVTTPCPHQVHTA